MKFTVAICTWNRAALLHEALASICRTRPPQTVEWELIVVNNNCSDGTDAVVGRFCDRLPVTLARESKPGLSHARNTAIEVASGDYILWTDDDVRVRPDWLVEYERAFVRWPEASVFGGAIVPLFESDPPQWLDGCLPFVDSAFAARDGRFAMLPVTPTRVPFGANFAVRAKEQRRFRYDPKKGRHPSRAMLTGEETAVIRAILAAGGSGWWLPAAASVDHWIPRSRQTMSYLRSYYKNYGWTLATDLTAPEWGVMRHRIPTLWCLAVAKELRYRGYRVLARPGKWAPAMISASVAWGRLAACR